MMEGMGRRGLDQRARRRVEHRGVPRRPILPVFVGLLLAACTSGGGEEEPRQPLAPTSRSPAVEHAQKPPLLPEGVDVLAVPDARVIRVWEHPAQAHAAFALDTQNPMGRTSPMLIDGAKRRTGSAWYEVLLPLRPNGSSGWVRAEDVALKRIDQRI